MEPMLLREMADSRAQPQKYKTCPEYLLFQEVQCSKNKGMKRSQKGAPTSLIYYYLSIKINDSNGL